MAESSGMIYGLMTNPGHNRVYYEASKSMALAELEIACRCFETQCRDLAPIEVEGISLVSFRAEHPLTEKDMLLLSRLSFVFAIFALEPREDGYVFLPIRKRRTGVMNDDVNTILKYSGKTNELFTRMMMNVGLLSGSFGGEPHISVLDPVAGKGTTLFEAAISGWNACGIEIGEKPVHEMCVFFRKYLETGKFKHVMAQERISGEDKRFRSEMTRFEYSVSKEAQKAGVKQVLCMVEGDGQYANHYFRREQFHMIVGDLPYGVQHGSHSQTVSPSLTRNPRELVKACLPAWLEVLKPGGTIVLAWNQFVLERETFASVFRIKGLTVLNDPPYDKFMHRVDQAINRDMIVVRKD